uniref:Protein EARLY HEADING DATE 2 n=1 Tax=Zea mays TaxID=4577 RepID=B4FB77_MAIZE|nr:unknown [Zea mays]
MSSSSSDPEAEVVALSPATLMATNRFLCEICGKGFQRDQNLQLHRRGHNLPWKLKQRGAGKEAQRKKVYVCPEASCVHHDPARALGDLTGIKKHFFRKHGEKKWKCDKCSKRYAVHSDWKAHSKICGTREYKCDCGTVFSRRDSFITHRAFCDALTEESAKAIGGVNAMAAPVHHHHHPMLFSPPPAHVMQQQDVLLLQEHQHHQHQQQQQEDDVMQQPPPQQCNYAMKTEMPPWPAMAYDHPLLQPLCNAAAAAAAQGSAATSAPQLPAASAHLSATALLQKAAQMGATIGGAGYTQMAGPATSATAAFGLGLPGLQNAQHHHPQQQDGGGGVMAAGLARAASSHGRGGDEGGGGGSGDGMTRDFLGLRAFSHRDILGLAGLDSSCMGAITASASMGCYEPQQQHTQPQAPQQQQSSNEPWHGMGQP